MRIEDPEQIHFVAWVRKQGYWCHHSPNEGKRSLVEGVRMKALGVSAGFPDVFVVLACGKYHGFFVEMKPEKGGKVTDSQLEWLAHLRSKGYYAEVAKGFEDAKRQFMDYLRLGDYA